MAKEKKPTLNEILGTKNKEEQAQRVVDLLNIPVFGILVMYDGRRDQLTVTPSIQLEPAAARAILSRAIEGITQQEQRELQGKAPPPPPPEVKPDEGLVENHPPFP